MKKKSLLRLFISTFALSFFAVGGGYVMLALTRKLYAEQYGWIKEEQLIDLAAIAQSSPGPITVNLAIIVGYTTLGLLGALVATVGTVLPPLVLLTIVSIFYSTISTIRIVSSVLAVMRVAVAAIIADVVIKMGGDVFRQKDIVLIAVMFCAFAADWWLGISIPIIVIISGVIGISRTITREKKTIV